jgi:ParB family chromosome partitioning protein
MAPDKSTRRLGRGLDALFNTPGSGTSETREESAFREIPVADIQSNPFQPRKSFKPEELKELQESLKSSGLLQPVTVRQSSKGSGYELIAGERRLRAAVGLGWEKIPAVVKNLTDQEILTLALVENLQRADLNPIEEAEGYEQLIRDFGYTQLNVASMVGKDRSTIANVLRILQLPGEVREMIEGGHLTAGQARPLLGLADQIHITAFARMTVEKGWSAREVEQRVREAGSSETAPAKAKRGRPMKSDARPAEVRSLEQRLRKHLQTDVTISLKNENRGTVNVEFYSADDLERVIELMGVAGNPQ